MILGLFLGYKDLVVTPAYLFVIGILIFYFKKFVPNKDLKPIFIRAFFAKIFSGIMLGVIYQFYYGGGDTSTYFYDGERLADVFYQSKIAWFKMVFLSMKIDEDTFPFYHNLFCWGDYQSYFVVRVLGIFNLLSFNTYTASAIFFAVFSFNGIWHMFLTFRALFPHLEKQIANACFFLPSLIFWGSGILKDSLLVCGIGWAFYAAVHVIFLKKKALKSIILLVAASIILMNVKPFVLVALMPSLLIWIIFSRIQKVKSSFGRTIYGPIIFIILFSLGFVFLSRFTKDTYFDVTRAEEITQSIKVSKDFLLYVAQNQNGSAYDIGEMDGSVSNAASLAPKAIWVTFFRPYPWESKNINMMMAALESFFFIVFTARTLYRVGIFKTLGIIGSNPFVLFCLTYSMFYGAVIDLSSANFGTLVRYKIPILPFYLVAFIVIDSYKKEKKVSEFVT